MTCIDSSVILISEKLSIISPTIIANGRETKSWPSGTELVYMIGRMSNVPATMDSTINCRHVKTRLSAITITDKRRASSIVMHMTKQQIKKMNATPALLPLTAKRSYFKLPGVSITLGKVWEDSLHFCRGSQHCSSSYGYCPNNTLADKHIRIYEQQAMVTSLVARKLMQSCR